MFYFFKFYVNVKFVFLFLKCIPNFLVYEFCIWNVANKQKLLLDFALCLFEISLHLKVCALDTTALIDLAFSYFCNLYRF